MICHRDSFALRNYLLGRLTQNQVQDQTIGYGLRGLFLQKKFLNLLNYKLGIWRDNDNMHENFGIMFFGKKLKIILMLL